MRVEDCSLNKNNDKIGIISSKTIKTFKIQNQSIDLSKPELESFFPKKVSQLTFDCNDKVIISDKFGDIYKATP